MATQAERTVVYGARIVQGMALVTFPAARNAFQTGGDVTALGPRRSFSSSWGVSAVGGGDIAAMDGAS